jgi:hypothetical protein
MKHNSRAEFPGAVQSARPESEVLFSAIKRERGASTRTYQVEMCTTKNVPGGFRYEADTG